MSGEPLVLVRDLRQPIAAATWPAGVVRLAFSAKTAPAGHALLAKAYENGFGSVGGFSDWYVGLVADEEYDEELCFLYVSGDAPVGFAQVWTSGFIKDIAVADSFRRQGIGKALVLTVFAALKARGLAEVRLKVHAGNDGAIALYRAMGMHEV